LIFCRFTDNNKHFYEESCWRWKSGLHDTKLSQSNLLWFVLIQTCRR